VTLNDLARFLMPYKCLQKPYKYLHVVVFVKMYWSISWVCLSLLFYQLKAVLNAEKPFPGINN